MATTLNKFNYGNTQKLKVVQISKTHNKTKLEKLICDETHKIPLARTILHLKN